MEVALRLVKLMFMAYIHSVSPVMNNGIFQWQVEENTNMSASSVGPQITGAEVSFTHCPSPFSFLNKIEDRVKYLGFDRLTQ